MKPLISIIVPAYNVEAYIAECLDSVIKQDNGRVEIVLVNDGSTDNTDEICRKYAEKYNIIRYFSKDNGGLSHARNYGIDKALGEYVNFLDSDDYLPDGAIEQLCNSIGKEKADVYMGLYTNLYPDGTVESCHYTLDGDKISGLHKEQLIEYLIDGRLYDWYAWLYTVKKEYLEKNRLYFAEGVTFEDVRWTPDVLFYADSVRYVPCSIYVYRRNRAGSITATFTKSFFDDKLTVFDFLNSFADKHGFSDEMRKKMFANMSNLYVSLLFDAWYLTKEERKAVFCVLKKYRFILSLSQRRYHQLISLVWSVAGMNITTYILFLRAKYVRSRQK